MVFIRAALVATTLFLSATGMFARADTVETFARADETWNAQISPDGKHLALGCSPRQVREVCVYELDSDARPKLFPAAEDARITQFYWASDKHLIVETNYFETLKTSSGLQDYRINRAIAFNVETSNSEPLMKGKMFVTDTTGIDAFLPSSPDKVLLTYTFSGERTEYEVDLNTGRPRALPDKSLADGVAFYDADGEIVALIDYDGPGSDYAVLNVRNGRETIFIREKAASPPFDGIWGLSADGGALIVSVDTDEILGLKQLSLETGDMTDISHSGEPVGDVSPIRDHLSNGLVGFGYTDSLYRQSLIDPVLANAQTGLAEALGKNVTILSWSRDRRYMTIAANQEGTPADFFLFDTEAGDVSPLGGEAPWLAATPLGTVSHITYQAEDGLDIPAYLTLPPGKTPEDGPFPLVLLPHGGPEIAQTAEYDWWAQGLANAGYAVLQPNFRGSAGSTSEFRNAGYGEFGGKMVTDVLDGAEYLVAEGIAAAGGYCVTGASYGGYSTLMAGLLNPEDTKCLIAVNAVSDPFSMMGEYAKAGGHDALGVQYWERYIGLNAFSANADKFAITPARRTDELSAPLLLIHGKEDTTVSFGQSRLMDSELGRRSDYKFVQMDGQDHFLSSTAARETVLRESLSFLGQHHPTR